MKKFKYHAIVVTLSLTLMGIALAQRPETDINPAITQTLRKRKTTSFRRITKSSKQRKTIKNDWVATRKKPSSSLSKPTMN